MVRAPQPQALVYMHSRPVVPSHADLNVNECQGSRQSVELMSRSVFTRCRLQDDGDEFVALESCHLVCRQCNYCYVLLSTYRALAAGSEKLLYAVVANSNRQSNARSQLEVRRQMRGGRYCCGSRLQETSIGGLKPLLL